VLMWQTASQLPLFALSGYYPIINAHEGLRALYSPRFACLGCCGIDVVTGYRKLLGNTDIVQPVATLVIRAEFGVRLSVFCLDYEG